VGTSHVGDTIKESLVSLYRSGWTIGDTAFHTEAGSLVWVVSGHNGENLIRSGGATETPGE
jgi:hypothetical protein